MTTMLLRLMLVGLVTGLGVQPASSADLARWVDEGRACLAEVLGLEANETDLTIASEEEETDDEGRPEAPQPADETPAMATAEAAARAEAAVNDAIFAAIADEMVDGFVADLAATRQTALSEAPVALADFVPTWVDDSEGFTGEAYALNQAADGTTIDPTPAWDDSPAPERNHRLANVLRLTSNALQAWAELLDKGRRGPTYQ